MTVPKPQNATLVDSISEGYAAINRRPWLVLIPLLLNLYLWFGAQVSMAPLITSITAMLKDLNPAAASQEEMQIVYYQFLATGGIDLRVLAFTLIVSVLTGVIFGLFPAIASSRVNLIDCHMPRAKVMGTVYGSPVASDAFFPFADGLLAAADAGATCAIQPGGSVRDQEVIAAADERNMAMIFTGLRHFRH